MISMESAPRDGTRVMVKCNVLLFNRDRWKYEVAGQRWAEMWFDGKDWQPWSGSTSVTSTASISDAGGHALGWAPVRLLEDYV